MYTCNILFHTIACCDYPSHICRRILKFKVHWFVKNECKSKRFIPDSWQEKNYDKIIKKNYYKINYYYIWSYTFSDRTVVKLRAVTIMVVTYIHNTRWLSTTFIHFILCRYDLLELLISNYKDQLVSNICNRADYFAVCRNDILRYHSYSL